MFRKVVICLPKQLPRSLTITKVTKSKGTEVKNKSPLIEKLSAEFGDVSSLVKGISEDEINSLHINDWRNRINAMKKIDFGDGECFKLISQYPTFLRIPTTVLEDNLRQWVNCEMGLDSVHELIKNHPQLLNIEANQIQLRVPYLICEFKLKHLFRLLLECPNVMFDDWQDTLNKINYLVEEKVVKKEEIWQSRALSMPLTTLMLRFDVLEKCGIYKAPTVHVHKRNKYDTSQFKNPHLNKITHNSDLFFATNVAKITLEEYLVFKNLFVFEYQGKNQNLNEEEDSDDD